MKRTIFFSIISGLLLLFSLSANAHKYTGTEYVPPDYDVGHPELITDIDVLLTQEELAKEVRNRPRKLAKVTLSEDTLASVKAQIEALLPKKPEIRPGDGQTEGTPMEERSTLRWMVKFKDNYPILKLRVTAEPLNLLYDQLEIVSVSKYAQRFTKPLQSFTKVKFKAGYFLTGSVTFNNDKSVKFATHEGNIYRVIESKPEEKSDEYYLYYTHPRMMGGDVITPDPEEVRKYQEQRKALNIPEYKPPTSAKTPDSIGQNPIRIDVLFLYEPEYDKAKIGEDIEAGIAKFNQLLQDASGPSTFYVHSLGYVAAPELYCQPLGEPCNKLHSFDEVLHAMRESPAITQLRRKPNFQADLIIMFRKLSEYIVLGEHSEQSVLGKAYNPPPPISASNYRWSVGAVTGSLEEDTARAIAHEIGHLMNAHHSPKHPDWDSRDKSNPNLAFVAGYLHATDQCPLTHEHGYHTFMAYEEVCRIFYQARLPPSCRYLTCFKIERFSENGVMANLKAADAKRVPIGSQAHDNFTVMNVYAHKVQHYSDEALQTVPPTANIHAVSGEHLRWENSCWNAQGSSMNSGVFSKAKWWVSIDGAQQTTETLYSVNSNFCFRPTSRKPHVLKLRITRQDGLNHTASFSFTPALPKIEHFTAISDLSYVNLYYRLGDNIQPPSHVQYQIYEKDNGDSKPMFRLIETTTDTSASFFRLTSAGDRLDYKVRVCANVFDCGPESDTQSVTVNIWAKQEE